MLRQKKDLYFGKDDHFDPNLISNEVRQPFREQQENQEELKEEQGAEKLPSAR